jgi:hypothetical protein
MARERRLQRLGWKNWKTKAGSPITASLVEQHLKGRLWVSPFKMQGSAPYVVLDLDRHHAFQESSFQTTLAAVKKLFPNSLYMRSSDSAGVHVYVKLPPGTYYSRAARKLQAFFALKGLRWVTTTSDTGKQLRTEVVEVPLSAPRLPFGLGSQILGSKKSPNQQLTEFIGFLKSADATDYLKAEKLVARELNLPQRWTHAARRRLEERLLDLELGLDKKKVVAFAAGDPWTQVQAKLSRHVRHVAARGIPSYATRTRWTKALVDELVDLVPEEQVRALMQHWLHHRDHASQEIEDDIDSVAQQIDKLITRTYRKLKGVPVRFWQVVEKALDGTWYLVRHPQARRIFPHVRHPVRLRRAKVRRAAFFILRRFFTEGQRERSISPAEFERFTGSNTSRDVEGLLTTGGRWWWLKFSQAAIVAHSRRQYRLLGLWPRRPGEPCLFLPP